jgi:hypothetical protein
MNNVFFTPEIKPDSANSSLQYLEAYKSPTGYFVFSTEEGIFLSGLNSLSYDVYLFLKSICLTSV